jgi:hypothetical protein
VKKSFKRKKILFYDQFLNDYDKADLEDVFTKEDYLKLFNLAFGKKVVTSDLNSSIPQIIIQLNKYLQEDRFNHYKPANELVKIDKKTDFFSDETLDNFEKIIQKINSLF